MFKPLSDIYQAKRPNDGRAEYWSSRARSGGLLFSIGDTLSLLHTFLKNHAKGVGTHLHVILQTIICSYVQDAVEPGMLHRDFGGSCTCCLEAELRETALGKEAGAGSLPIVPVAKKRPGRPEDWVLDCVPAYQQ